MAPSCFVCGQNKGDVKPVSKALCAHPRCFCAHQIRSMMNHGRLEQCPVGPWTYDLRADLPNQVKPEFLPAVNALLEEGPDAAASNSHGQVKSTFEVLQAAAGESMANLVQLCMI